MCQKFKETKAFYSDIVQAFRPPLLCPIKPGNYTTSDTTVNLDLVSRLPLNGYRWLVTFKLISGSSTKKVALCLDSETVIQDVRETRKRKVKS
jgi:hypothetical protein